ncbi:hypothetical protein FFLO_05030 [Filobasidium floriforme]|uniref:Uncharacterized protein n=1 Tax=Filobasidium floriforme TaxID=5210 RepID=A0A8K0NRQ3_9TREE|nr:hypothetical protein FFLO_05030 [Filobasidium floriforme]
MFAFLAPSIDALGAGTGAGAVGLHWDCTMGEKAAFKPLDEWLNSQKGYGIVGHAIWHLMSTSQTSTLQGILVNLQMIQAIYRMRQSLDPRLNEGTVDLLDLLNIVIISTSFASLPFFYLPMLIVSIRSMTNPVQDHRKFLDEISVRRVKRRRLLQTAGSTSNNDINNENHDTNDNDNDDTPSRLASPKDKPRPHHIKPENKTHDEVLRSSYKNYSPGEETIRNDYLVEYIVSGVWNASWIKGVGKEVDECREYPKLHRLQALKRSLVSSHAHPPLYLTLDPVSESPLSLPSLLSTPPASSSSLLSTSSSQLPPNQVFDVIHIRPPPLYTPQELSALPIRHLSADPSFVFLWVGPSDGDGLERGREMLMRWGFRRCEEVVWVRTKRSGGSAKGMKGTKRGDGSGRVGVGGGDRRQGRASFKRRRDGTSLPKDDIDDESENAEGKEKEELEQEEENEEDPIPTNLLVTQKEHCLVGIRGTVRRKTDGWFVHCNVDTDIIVWDPDPTDPDPPAYPPQIYSIIENFCLGTRRLDLFAPASKSGRARGRKGWVTVGPDRVGVEVGVDGEREAEGEELEEAVDGKPSAEGDIQGETEGEEGVKPFDPVRYANWLEGNKDEMGRYVLPLTQEIDNLRPKSPVRGERAGDSHGLPNRPGFVDRPGSDRGRQQHQQRQVQGQGQGYVHPHGHGQQGILSPTSMATPMSMSPSMPMDQNHNQNQGAVGMNPMMKIMNMNNNPAFNNNNMGMMNTGMGMGMPMLGMNMNMGMGMGMGMGMNMPMNMGMGFPMMGMPMMGMNMGNAMLGGMFGNVATTTATTTTAAAAKLTATIVAVALVVVSFSAWTEALRQIGVGHRILDVSSNVSPSPDPKSNSSRKTYDREDPHPIGQTQTLLERTLGNRREFVGLSIPRVSHGRMEYLVIQIRRIYDTIYGVIHACLL